VCNPLELGDYIRDVRLSSNTSALRGGSLYKEAKGHLKHQFIWRKREGKLLTPRHFASKIHDILVKSVSSTRFRIEAHFEAEMVIF
jgi:hypothetical protein